MCKEKKPSQNFESVCKVIIKLMRFVAFLATEYDDVFSGYQPGQLVEQ
jgi:hypothetical protein